MNTVTIILLVILVILTGILIALYFTGKRLQKKQAENQAQIEAMKQPATTPQEKLMILTITDMLAVAKT